MKSSKSFTADSFWIYSGALLLFILIVTNTAFASGRHAGTLVSGNTDSSLARNYTEASGKNSHFVCSGADMSLENTDTVRLISKTEMKKSQENKSGYPGRHIVTTTDTEKSLPIESWMINNRYFETCWITDADKELKIEAWMTDKHLWGH